MKFEDVERQAFEEFGEISVDNDANQDIDLTAEDIEIANDALPEVISDIPPHVANDIVPIIENLVPAIEGEPKAELPQIIETAHHEPVKTAFSWAGFAGGLAALLWVVAAIGGPISYYGIDAVLTLDPAMQAGLIALAFGPAMLFWLSAAAAGEALKARRLAMELTRFARAGAPAREEARTVANDQHLVVLNAKSDIQSLNDAVAMAMNRLAELEASAQRNVALFDGAIAASRESTAVMADHLARERDALVELNAEMKGQAETVSQSIGRQIRMMREASKLVKTEITSAEGALETQLNSFTAQAATMAERTIAFHQAANDATAASSSLNATITEMLDGLSEATRLTDSARQSSQDAVRAANDTAITLRETTRTAVFEAKKAAQFIRAETAALQDAAADTLTKLQAAADAARASSQESQAAADRHAASIEKRLAALSSTASVKKPDATVAPERKPVAPALPSTLQAAAEEAIAQARALPADPSTDRTFANGFKWVKKPAAAPKTPDAFELVDFPSRRNADVKLKHNAVDLVVNAGIDLDAVLRPADLERIALQSRQGASARRRAVVEAAPNAVTRLARHIKRNPDAQRSAEEFRSRPDLAKSENKGEGKDLVRAYLLIDAALV